MIKSETSAGKRLNRMGLIRTAWLFMLISIALIPSSILAQENTQSIGKLRVGVFDIPPYAMQSANGKWEGLSIEVWQIIAGELGAVYEFKEFSRRRQAADALQRAEIDVIPLVHLTESYETVMDLSHSYHRSGLAIAVPQKSPGIGWIGYLQRFASADTLKLVGLLLLLSVISGIIIWFLENKKNREMFGGNPSQGIASGIWWAMVTMTTVGYGDKAPRTAGGRVVAVIWMFFSIILVTSYTAVITASFTVEELSGKVRSPSDLVDARVGALANSKTLEYLEEIGIPVQPFNSLEEALQAVDDNRLDAVVDDDAQLQYLIKKGFQGKLNVLPETFAHYYVSMALSTDSRLREPLNRALARIIDRGEWTRLEEKYMVRAY